MPFGELRIPLKAVTPKVLSEARPCARWSATAWSTAPHRTAYDENPPRVEYALTALGRTLIPLLAAARTCSESDLRPCWRPVERPNAATDSLLRHRPASSPASAHSSP
ncbi:winged helix-turn-helix transcriptional regulator [Streptomyces sp. NPDC001393]